MEVSLRKYLFLPTKINLESISQGIDIGVLRYHLVRFQELRGLFLSLLLTQSVTLDMFLDSSFV